ncbi:MAG: energy transducer TonB, partial [Eudoraea sp.]|nr:energy transducer TonB [Eudoraea sp.]
MSLLDTRHKKKSFTLTTILLSILVLLLFYIGLTYMEPPIENGITVNFGTMEFGMGDVQPKEKIRSEKSEIKEVVEETVPEEIVPAEPEEQVIEDTTTEAVEKVITQEDPETIRIRQQAEARKRAEAAAKKAQAEAERKERERREAEERQRREEDAKKKKLDAIMGGINNSDGDATGSEGDDN